MMTDTKNGRKNRTAWSAALVVCVVIAVALVPLATGGCESGDVKTLVGEFSASATWTGNGSDNIDGCQTGLHWILTPAGSGSLQSATLHVNFGGGYVSYTGYQPGGQGNGAFHFDSGAGAVTAAYADYTYDGSIRTGNVVLTISHCNDSSTSTTVGQTTTTAGGVTSTTTGGETTTTGGETTTTIGATTSTVVGGLTSTTVVGETTTTVKGETTTTDADTTTTVVAGLTSTTVKGETTTTIVGGMASTTVVGNLTTAGRIDTGGGGTAGPNVMLWLAVALLGALAVALGGSAIWSGLKQKGAR